jgi:hypothetical protein
MPVTSASLSSLRLRALLVVQLALVASCTDPIEPDVTTQLTSCDVSDGTVQQSSGSATWGRAGSPHRLEGEVTISGALTIEAGALVCASPAAALTVTDSLIAIGTSSDSIRIVPVDASAGWQGLDVGRYGSYGRSFIRFARLEGGLILANSPLRMENVLVERGGVKVSSYSGASLEDVVVRESPGVGIYVPWRSGISLSAVRIEESAGIGLSLVADPGGSAQLTIDRPIRITGGATYPASVPVSVLDELLGEAGAADSLTGNAQDTLLVLAMGQHTLPMTITPALAWRISAGGGCVCATLGPLHMEAGSTLRLNLYSWGALGVSDLTADGSSGARASIIGGSPSGGNPPLHWLALAGDSATLRGAHIHNVRVHAAEGTRVTIDDITASNSGFELAAAGAAALSNVRLHAGQEPGLVLGPGATAHDIVVTASAGHGVTVRGAGVQLTSCTIGGNTGHGILAESGDVVIRDCSLLPNGVEAAAAEPGAVIDARDNWWGDPSGPDAGAVSGTVTYEPFLSAAPAAESDAATIEIFGGSVVATSDTIRLDAIVRDADGNEAPFEAVVWSALDASTAEVFAGGLVFGADVGETTITATVNGNPAVQTSVTIQVVRGAPVFDWEQWRLDETGADVWAHDGHVLVVSHGGRIFRFDGSTWSTEQITSADLWVREIWGRSASDVYVLATDRSVPNVPRSRLYHYDGSAWTSVFDADGLPGRISGTADGHVFLALQAGLMHYDGSSWEQIVDGSIHSVSARAADDVFYVAGYGPTIAVWRFDGTTSHDVGAPGPLRLWSAADVLLGIGNGLWLYGGPDDWRQLEGSSGIPIGDAAGEDSTDLFAVGDNFELHHFDGSVLRPVWVRGAPSVIGNYEPVVAVDGPDVYILKGWSLLRGTRR